MKRAVRVAAVAAAGLIAVLAVGVAITAVRAADYPAHWRDVANEPVREGDVRMVVLGDSAMTAVGALDPANGIAERIRRMAAEVTGRSVRLDNRAVGGATVADIVRDQLDDGDLAEVDLVLVSTTNDLQQSVSPDEYRAALDRLFLRLPADRVVMGDLPPMPGSETYQQILAEATAAHDVARADVAAVFEGPGHRLDVFSLLPPHLNDTGYGFWADAFRGPVRRILAPAPTCSPVTDRWSAPRSLSGSRRQHEG